jgi:hypothetical protein
MLPKHVRELVEAARRVFVDADCGETEAEAMGWSAVEVTRDNVEVLRQALARLDRVARRSRPKVSGGRESNTRGRNRRARNGDRNTPGER